MPTSHHIQKLARNDRHLSVKTIKLVEENIEVNLHNLGLGKAILDTTPKAQGTKEKIDKMNSSKLKTLVLKRHKENEKITQRMG